MLNPKSLRGGLDGALLAFAIFRARAVPKNLKWNLQPAFPRVLVTEYSPADLLGIPKTSTLSEFHVTACVFFVSEHTHLPRFLRCGSCETLVSVWVAGAPKLGAT